MSKKRNKDIYEKQNAADRALRKIAEREGVTVDSVRRQIQIAMINGLSSTDPKVKAFWDSIPRENEIPTPEELILYISGTIVHKDIIR